MDQERQVCAFYYKNKDQQDDSNENKRKSSVLLTIILVILLIIFLIVSLLLLNKRTNFLNFASNYYEEGNLGGLEFLTKKKATDYKETETSTNIQISTKSSTMIIPVPSATPLNTPGNVVIENSYIFASPLTATTGNFERIRITVFILDGTGSGISGETVALTGVSKLAVYSVQAVTDTIGRALFDVAAGTSGIYEIGASVGGVSIPQKITVTFN